MARQNDNDESDDDDVDEASSAEMQARDWGSSQSVTGSGAPRNPDERRRRR